MIDGYQPGQDGFALTPENRPAVQAWLKAEGIAPARVDGMRDDTLFKAYRWPAYLKQMKTRADYYPSCAKPKDDTPCLSSQSATTICAPHAPTVCIAPDKKAPAELTGRQSLMTTDTRSNANSTSNAPPALITSPPPTDPATILAQLFLTEARVIELIREHAPAIIMELLKR